LSSHLGGLKRESCKKVIKGGRVFGQTAFTRWGGEVWALEDTTKGEVGRGAGFRAFPTGKMNSETALCKLEEGGGTGPKLPPNQDEDAIYREKR